MKIVTKCMTGMANIQQSINEYKLRIATLNCYGKNHFKGHSNKNKSFTTEKFLL